MRIANSRFVWIIPQAVLILGIISARLMGTWSWLSGSDKQPEFNDLKQLTYTSECSLTNPIWTMQSQTCDPNGRAYNYPSVWVSILRFSGVTSSETNTIGWLLIVLTVVALGLLFFLVRGRITSIRQIALLSIAAVSPPVWLAMDRGNSDVVIFFLVIASIGMSITRFKALSVPILMLATALKIYAFGAGLFFMAFKRRGYIYAVVLAGFVAVYGLMMREELSLISQRTPRPNHMAFGVTVLPSLLLENITNGEFATGRTIGLVSLGLFILILLGVLVASIRSYRLRSSLAQMSVLLADDVRLKLIFLAGSGVILVAYLVGSSYDYMLMFLIPVFVSLLLAEVSKNLIGRIFLLSTLILLLFSGHWLVLGRLADFLWLIYVPVLLLLMVKVALSGASKTSEVVGNG